MFKLLFFFALAVFAGLLIRRFVRIVAHHARGGVPEADPRAEAPEKDVSRRARIIEENSNDGR